MSNLKLVTVVVTACLLSLLIYIRPDTSATDKYVRPQISPAEQTLPFTAPKTPTQCLPLPSATTEKAAPMKNCSLPFAVMFDGGRLGNQMCQYLSLMLLRKQFGIKIAIRAKMKRILTTSFENVRVPLIGSKCFTQHTQRIPYRNMYNQLFNFNEGNPEAYPLSKSYFISDYPCPIELLLPWREKLSKALVFKPKILEEARRQMHRSLEAAGLAESPDLTVVTVHVRRTDYISYVKSHYGLPPLTKTYFHRAFDYFRERFAHPVFLITTDDKKWCEDHILGPDVLYAGSKNPSVDIALLSQGNHTIVSFGTFGFVSAFLGKGMIVHPETNPTYNCENSGVTLSVPVS